MYSIWVNSEPALQFDPEFDIVNRSQKNQSEHRTRGGKQFTYKWGGINAFKFGINFVNSSFASTINQWWLDNRDIDFAEDSSDVVYHMRIINDKVPMAQYIQPYDTLYHGVIELESYSSTRNSCLRYLTLYADYGIITDVATASIDMGSIMTAPTNCEIDYGTLF